MADELNEDSTKEDAEELVAQFVEEDKAAQAEETNETIESPTDEDDSGSEPDESQEESGWITDDLIAEVAERGLDESDLSDFADREELDRALKLMEKTASKEVDPFEEDEAPKTGETQYEPLDSDVYDEEIVSATNSLHARLSALEEQNQGLKSAANERSFDAAIDSLENSSLFGKTGSEDSKQLQNRKAVHKAAVKQVENLGEDQGEVDRWVGILARGMFAEDFDKRTIKNRTRQLSKQSNARQGGGTTRPNEPREDPGDKFERMYRKLDGQS